VAGSIVTGEITSSAAEGSLLASAAGPIGAAVTAAIVIITSLLAAHEKRLQDAKTENQRAGVAVSSFYQTLQQIVAALNAGQLAPSDAISALQQLDQVTLASLRQFVGQPGTAWNSSTPGVCDKTCTVSCCLYNTWLHPDLFGAPGKQGLIPVIQQGGGSLNVAGIPTNKYGLPPLSTINLTINPPTATASVTGALDSLVGGTGTGGSGLLWIGLAAVAAVFLMNR
jgi:hypothetical protein